MRLLAIDTSCDDTSVAVLEKKGREIKILSNIVSSQVKVHQKYGGVFPWLAKREHGRNLLPVLTKALKQGKLLNLNLKSKISNLQLKTKNLKKILKKEPELLNNLLPFLSKYQKPKIQAIAVTVGPGLEPCLWVGANFAKALALTWNIPLIPVNHIEGHLSASFAGGNSKSEILNPKQTFFPAIGLVVSGGHTQLILIKGIGKYKIIGETRDDAAGECFDKTARILGLDYPGGPSIAKEAKKIGARKFAICNLQFKINLPRPMLNSDDYDFSFSGLKTAVLYDWQKRTPKEKISPAYKQAMAFEIQQAVIDVLIKKTIQAARYYQAKSILLSGGVAANQELRRQFNYLLKTKNYKLNFFVPPKKLCTDNAAMIGIAGLFGLKYSNTLKVNGNLRLC